MKGMLMLLAMLLTVGCQGQTQAPQVPDNTEEVTAVKIIVTVDGTQFPATLADTQAAKALAEKLPLTMELSELNGNEKYGMLDEALPTAATSPGSIHSGDLMLYGRDCLVLFYQDFSTGYQYTPLGKLDDAKNLAAAVGSGSVTVTLEAAE